MDKKMKVMIIDDDKFLLNMYVVKFKNIGYEVDSSVSAMEAIDKLKNGLKPDIIICDLIMPGLDGFDFLKMVKKDKLAEKGVFVMLTNQGQSADIEKAVGLGVDGYIVKATTIPSEVVEEVKSIYDKRSKETKDFSER